MAGAFIDTPAPKFVDAPAPKGTGRFIDAPAPKKIVIPPLAPDKTYGAIGNAVGSGVGGLSDLLGRSGAATQAALARRDTPAEQRDPIARVRRGAQVFGQAFTHGVPAAQQQANLDESKRRLGVKDAIDALPGPLRGVADAGVSTLLDPMTAVPFGAPARLARAGLGLTRAAVGAIPRAGPEILHGAEQVGRMGQQIFGLGGKGAEEVKHVYGPAAKDTFLGAQNRAGAEGEYVTNTLLRRRQQAVKGLSAAEKTQVQQILHGEDAGKVSPRVTEAAAATRKILDDAFHAQASVATRAGMAAPHASLTKFPIHPGTATTEYKTHYLPAPREATTGADRGAVEFDPSRYQNPRLLPQGEFHVDPTVPHVYEDALDDALRKAGKSVTATHLQHYLGEAGLGDSPIVQDALKRSAPATGRARTPLQYGADLAKGVTGYGKAAQVSFTPYHIGNIGSLLALRRPDAIPETIWNTAKLMFARGNPEKAYDILREGINRGAVGPAHDRLPFLNKIPGVGAYTKFNNDLVWNFDKSAQQALAKRSGEGFASGRRANEALIDYHHPSEFAKGPGAYLSRFPTYRTQLPGAVLKSVGHNPALAGLLNHLTSGYLFGGDVPGPDGQQHRSSFAAADIGRMTSPGGVTDYARSSASDPVRLGLAEGGAGIAAGEQAKGFHVSPDAKRELFWGNYGHDPNTLKNALNLLSAGLPFGRDVSNATGISPFAPKSIQDRLSFDLLGDNAHKPYNTRRPGLRTQMIQRLEDEHPDWSEARARYYVNRLPR
jgi:hypothetical protein